MAYLHIHIAIYSKETLLKQLNCNMSEKEDKNCHCKLNTNDDDRC